MACVFQSLVIMLAKRRKFLFAGRVCVPSLAPSNSCCIFFIQTIFFYVSEICVFTGDVGLPEFKGSAVPSSRS